MTDRWQRRGRRRRQRLLWHEVVGACVFGVIVINVMVLYNSVEQTLMLRNHDKFARGQRWQTHYNYNTSTSRRQMRRRASDATRRRIEHRRVQDRIVDNDNSVIVVSLQKTLARVQTAMEQHACGPTPPSGLLQALQRRNSSGDDSDSFRCSLWRRSRSSTPPEQAEEFSGVPTRMTLIMTTTAGQSENGNCWRRPFVNLLKWLSLEQQQQPGLANVTFQWEAIWLLVPSRSSSAAMEQDADYGRRLLAWDAQPQHPVQLAEGNSFWEAVAQVQAVASVPVLWVDGDAELLLPQPLTVWFHRQRLQKWTARNNERKDTTLLVGSTTTTTTAITHSNADSDTPPFCPPSGDASNNHDNNRTMPVVVPELHLSMHDPFLLCFLQHPLAAIRNETMEDWRLASQSAAVWLSWLAAPALLVDKPLGATEERDDTRLWQVLRWFGGVPSSLLAS